LQLRAVDVLPTPISLGDEAKTRVARLRHHGRIFAPRDIPEGGADWPRAGLVDGTSRENPHAPRHNGPRCLQPGSLPTETTASSSDTEVDRRAGLTGGTQPRRPRTSPGFRPWEGEKRCRTSTSVEQ
jgi:hypothetical protein